MFEALSTLMRFQKCLFSSRRKPKQNNFIHSSVFISFLTIHTKTLKNDVNDRDLGLCKRAKL